MPKPPLPPHRACRAAAGTDAASFALLPMGTPGADAADAKRRHSRGMPVTP